MSDFLKMFLHNLDGMMHRNNVVEDLISKTLIDGFYSQNDSHVDQWNKKAGFWMHCLENTAWLFHR